MIKFLIGLSCWVVVGHVLNTLNASGWQIATVCIAMAVSELSEGYFTRKDTVKDVTKIVEEEIGKLG